jgi:hypothetical protein
MGDVMRYALTALNAFVLQAFMNIIWLFLAELEGFVCCIIHYIIGVLNRSTLSLYVQRRKSTSPMNSRIYIFPDRV